MNVNVAYSRIIPFKGFFCMNFFGLLIFRREDKGYVESALSHPEYHPSFMKTINHESIHTAQMKETLYIGFYILYLLEWLIRLITPPYDSAYRDISFEREAYSNEKNLNYLDSRPHFVWTKYIFRRD